MNKTFTAVLHIGWFTCRAVVSLSLLGGQDKNISSIFLILLDFFSHFSSNLIHVLHFGLLGGWLTHPWMLWLRHCSFVVKNACVYRYMCKNFKMKLSDLPIINDLFLFFFPNYWIHSFPIALQLPIWAASLNGLISYEILQKLLIFNRIC